VYIYNVEFGFTADLQELKIYSNVDVRCGIVLVVVQGRAFGSHYCCYCPLLPAVQVHVVLG